MRSFLAILGAASCLALLAVPAFAVQHTPGSHVAVQTCMPHKGKHMHTQTFFGPYGRPYTRTVAGRASTLEIDYKNMASQAAKEIDFGLVARKSLVAQVKDSGTFSPNILIQHEFDIPHSVFPLGTALPQCAILKVVYADGSVWTNPNPPTP